MKKFLPKGYIFSGPNGQGYTLLRDVYSGETVIAEMFKAFGGAPEPENGKQMPSWLGNAIRLLAAKKPQ